MIMTSQTEAASAATRAASQLEQTTSLSRRCPRKLSAVRPVSSAFPAFIQNPDTDPQGFAGFAARGSFSRS
jgi:hypothetical protein